MENETTLAELIHRGGIFKNVEGSSPEEIYDNWESMQEMIAYDEERYNQQGL